MRTIRRIYLYLVTVISLQTVLWGVINLLRAMLDTQRVGGGGTQLAGALATIIVGVPVFLLHWWLIQRRIPVDAEERGSDIRAIFLYGLLLGLLIPVAQNLLAILNRAFLDLFNVRPEAGLLGINQTWIDNGIAMIINALLAAYFMNVIRRDWRAGLQPEKAEAVPSLDNLTLFQRVFRYLLVLYTLGLMIFGVQQILQYILDQFGPPNINALSPLANGLSLAIFGAMLWWNAWRTVQLSLQEEAEQKSFFRLVFLYLGLFVGLGVMLFSIGAVLYETLLYLFGAGGTFVSWIQEISEPLSVSLPFALLWLYHLNVLRADQEVVVLTPRRKGTERLYLYLVAFIGLMVSFFAVQSVIDFLIDQMQQPGSITRSVVRTSLASGIASLIIGLPVWVRPWLKLNAAAQLEGDPGDQARRSTVRKIYLYLVIFIGVVGVMISAGSLIFEGLNLALGARTTVSFSDFLELFQALALFVALLLYHWQVLRGDNRLEDQSLTQKHNMFPVLVLDQGDQKFASPIVSALRDEAPGIPVAVHFTSTGVPGEDLSGAGAVVLSAGMAANPPEATRIWLQSYGGVRIVVPIEKEGWVWIDADTASETRLSKEVARTVRKLAEGEALESGRMSGWMMAASIIGGFFLLIILISILGSLLNF